MISKKDVKWTVFFWPNLQNEHRDVNTSLLSALWIKRLVLLIRNRDPVVFDPWIRVPDYRMEKTGSGINITDQVRELSNNFLG